MRHPLTARTWLDVQRLGDEVLHLRDGSLRGVLECRAVPTPDLPGALAVLAATRHGGQVVLQSRREVPIDGTAPTTLLRASYAELLTAHQMGRALLDRLLVVVPWDVGEGGDGTQTLRARLANVSKDLAEIGLEPVRLLAAGLDALIRWSSVEESQRRVRVDGRFGRTLALTASPDRALSACLGSLDVERDLSLHLRRRGRDRLELAGYLTVWTESCWTLDGAAADAQKILTAAGTEPRQPHFQAKEGLVSTLPICVNQLAARHRVPERVFLYAGAAGAGRSRPGDELLHGFHPHSRRPVVIDRSALPNPTCVIAGTERGSRLRAVALEVLRARMSGRQIHIVDPCGDHTRVAKALGGVEISPTPNGGSPFDPFPVRARTGSLSDRIRTLTAVVDVMCGGLQPAARAAVEDAISFCYAVRGHVDGDTALNTKPPDIADLRATLAGRASRAENGCRHELERAIEQLGRIVDGDLRSLVGPERALPVGVPLTVHNLARLPEADRPVGQLLSLDRVWRLCAGGPATVVVDAVDALLRHDTAAGVVARVIRSAVERRMAVTLVVEDLDAALRGPLRGPLASAGMKVLLHHAPEAAERLGHALRLTPAEQTFLAHANDAEGLLIAEARRRPFFAPASDEELRLLTKGGIFS